MLAIALVIWKPGSLTETLLLANFSLLVLLSILAGRHATAVRKRQDEILAELRRIAHLRLKAAVAREDLRVMLRRLLEKDAVPMARSVSTLKLVRTHEEE